MHAVSSFRGNRPTNKQTNKPTDRTNYNTLAAPLSLARSVFGDVNKLDFHFVATFYEILNGVNRKNCLYYFSL